MKKLYVTALLLTQIALSIFSQAKNISMKYEPSREHPYGLLNPIAPAEVADFDPIIGTCDCRSLQRNGDGTWPDTLDMVTATAMDILHMATAMDILRTP